LGQDRISERPIGQIRPSPENAKLYRPVDRNDPDVKALAESIREHGLQEPLVVTRDGWIISGHRRHVAARLAGLKTVPCRVHPIRREGDRDQFIRLLREFNRQRVKSFDEKLREEVVSVDPEEAYRSLIAHRNEMAAVAVDELFIRERKWRPKISAAKVPLLEAVKRVIESQRRFWPLSDRRIHYALLNDPPLIHASKPKSTYANTKPSYKALVDLVTRARLEGLIPMQAIADETRPVTIWDVHGDPQGFVRREMGRFLKGYWRDLMQSQPNHVEIVGEKNTIAPTIKPVAARYRIPMTIGRGFCSLRPRFDMSQRFRKSGKQSFVLLILSDFDPDGEEIAHSLARSLRDDFGVDEVKPVKVALTADQVEDYDLPPTMQAKETSANYKRFANEHGEDVFELEALAPEDLQAILQETIDSVIDVEAFNHEIDQEKQDAAFLERTRRTVSSVLGDLDLGDHLSDEVNEEE